MSPTSIIAQHTDYGARWGCACPLCGAIGRQLDQAGRDRLTGIMAGSIAPPVPVRLWHYSSEDRLLDADALLPHAAVPAHPPCVWLTRREGHEPLLLHRDGPPRLKIAVDHDPARYADLYAFGARVERVELFGVALSALLAGSDPLDWWCSWEPIPAALWIDAVVLHWR